MQSSHANSEPKDSKGEAREEPIETREEDERRPGQTRRSKPQPTDFKVEILEFEGQLNPDDFLDWP